MDKEKGMERALPKIKKTVDAVYEYLAPHQDGCGMSAKDYGKKGARVISSLVNRKIIERTNLGHGEYKYKWVATMAPTSTLYRSIALEIQAESREYYKNHKNKKKALSKVEDCPAPAVVSEPVETKSIADQVMEMWARMKEMGVSIENNQLVLTEVKVTKTVLS